MAMSSRKVARVASRIRFLVSSIIQRQISDPRLGFVTILRVEPTEDLKEAKVYFSVLGDEAVKSRTCHALDRAQGFIQREVGRNLETRNTPRLYFMLDETQDKLERFEQLIDRAIQEDQENRHGEEGEKKEEGEEPQSG